MADETMENEVVTIETFMSGDVMGVLTIDGNNAGRLKVFHMKGDLMHTSEDFKGIEEVTHEAEVYMMDVKHSTLKIF